MKRETKLEELKNINLFSNLTTEELIEIAQKIQIKSLIKGQVVIYPEDTNETFYAILKGKVKITKTDFSGKEIILAIHQSGDFFGELSVIDGRTCPATAHAVESSTIALIARDDFQHIIHNQTKVLNNLLFLMCSRLRDAWNVVEMLNFDNASKRIKMFLLISANKYGINNGDGITIKMKLTHQDIAEMTGVTRETVTRILNIWKKNKDLLILDNKYIHLKNDFLKTL
ncbi:MAG: Crp/Fnr family transcriptional regulator [Candidatus Magnetoovum sp. WYHC-5]|nr:Crp/Fnr family transcriptional regulator [Candidatus Magnetoovum sp. WYHC-5]